MRKVVIGGRNRVLTTEDTLFLSGAELVANFAPHRQKFENADALVWAWYALDQNGKPDVSATLRGTEAILNSIHAMDLPGVFLSTDAVFSGREGNYSETDHPDPQSDYGRIKVAQEALMKHFLRLRFTTFGPSFNPSRPLLIEMIADSTPKVTRPNQFFSPISTVSLNRVIDDLLRGDKLPRVYHLASQRISKTDCFHRLAKSIGVTLSPFPLTDVSELDLSLESRTHNFLISEEIALTTAARSKCHHA